MYVTRMFVRMFVRMLVRMLHVCLYVYLYVCLYVCLHVCLYVCLYVCWRVDKYNGDDSDVIGYDRRNAKLSNAPLHSKQDTTSTEIYRDIAP